MSTHKVFVGNAVYPGFRSTPTKYRNFAARSDRIAGIIKDSGADCATIGELGKPQAARLAQDLPWQYDRAQGGGVGMNTVWSNPKVWDQPEDRISDYNMPSGGQMQRTLILCRLIEKADPTAFVGLTCGHESLGNDAGMAYVRKMIDKIGDRRALIGMDFKRTDDTDDLAAMKRAGFEVHGRTRKTPMVCFTKGAVKVLDVEPVNDLRAFDHQALVVTFSIANAKDQA